MAVKRKHQEMDSFHGNARASPFLPMFEDFRTELNEHHDRRERIVKLSRDITASSKKIIFSLQRVQSLNQVVPSAIAQGMKQYYESIVSNFAVVSVDLQQVNAFRYERQISGGIQEYLEAIIFRYYLETQRLLTYDMASQQFNSLAGDGKKLVLNPQDYILGVFDMTGELMRFGITSMATTGHLPGSTPTEQPQSKIISNTIHIAHSVEDSRQRHVLHDLRELRSYFEALDYGSDSFFLRDVEGKMTVMRTCVEKVEKALYGLIIRGSERPKGWIPDMRDDGRERDQVES